MDTEVKEDKNSSSSDMKVEDAQDKISADEKNETKQSSKESAKKDEEEDDEESDKEESEDESEEEVALLDRPVEVTGCRARKQVERLDVSFKTTTEKQPEFPEGKGVKLGDCPKIEAQIQKTKAPDLKPLHKILFGRLGSGASIKKNIRKFCGFSFEQDTTDYTKKKASIEKNTNAVLKSACSILALECGGSKEVVVNRILNFLMCPEDKEKAKAGKKVQKKAVSKKEPKKSEKKSKSEKDSGGEAENVDGDSSESDSMGGSEEHDLKAESSSEEEAPKKSKKSNVKNKAEKSDKDKKDEKKTKGVKRKHSEESNESSDDDEPIAKKSKMPSDDDISELVKKILDAADLQEITMKKVIKQVSDAYPDFDLSHKKAFIKQTIKSVIS